VGGRAAQQMTFGGRYVEAGRARVRDRLDGAVALIEKDRDGAAAFVERELGPVTAMGSRGERLVKTLEAFLQHGQRIANASAISGLHRDTVHRHLREIESLLGCKIEERSADLLWAIRMRRVLCGARAHLAEPSGS
jgi:DNA-binding PucR family transcriptional regulator